MLGYEFDWAPDSATGPAFFKDPARGCAPGKVDPDWFFETVDGIGRNKAIAQCRRCPFMNECDDWATQHEERWGVWGGRIRSPRLVAALRRKQEV
jgi:hypothetical protein